jgi:hypothetical protein
MGSLWSWSGRDVKNSLVYVNNKLEPNFYKRYFNDKATNINGMSVVTFTYLLFILQSTRYYDIRL